MNFKDFTPEDFNWLLPDLGSTSKRVEIADFVNNKTYINKNSHELDLEEIESAHMYMDKLGVPRTDTSNRGMKYSLSGRIALLKGR